MNILVVAGEYIYPPNNGGRVDIWSRIKVLYELGYKIDIICTVKHEPNDVDIEPVKKIVENIVFVKRKNNILNLVSKLPLQAVSRKSLVFYKLKKHYDIVLLEGLYVSQILYNKNLNYKHVIMRMHNNEVKYFKELGMSTNNILKKIYYYTESAKFKIYEKKILPIVKNIMFISYDEQKYYNSVYNLNDIFLPAVTELNFKKQKLTGRTVLILGSLFMSNNREGIIWYLRNIHPKLMKIIDNYRLIIAGNSRNDGIKWLDKYVRNYTNIVIKKSPTKLDDIYAQSAAFVNPMLHGAGVKLKTINAVVNGLPVITTGVGNEGTGLKAGECVEVSNDIHGMVKDITKILTDKKFANKLASNAQNYILKQYNYKNILNEYIFKLIGK